jgi:hypothetical protein
MHYKRNQVEQVICQTFGAEGARADELKLRLKRLLVTDRRLVRRKGADKRAGRGYAFYSQEAPGSGTEVMFSAYEGFALLAGVMMLEHGLPQANVVRVLRQVRSDLERAHRETLRMNTKVLFDRAAVRRIARPGMIATDNTAPVFMAFVRVTGSTVDTGKVTELITVCRGHEELSAFIQKHAAPGLGATFFEFAGLMHRLAQNLAKTRPVKRGRPTL